MGEVVRLASRSQEPARIDPGTLEEANARQLTGTPPPHDLGAEEALLGAAILHPAIVPALLDVVKPSDFFAENNARIWQAVVGLALSQTPIDVVSVRSWLAEQRTPAGRPWLDVVGGIDRLGELCIDCPNTRAENAMSRAERIADHATDRELIATLQRRAAERYLLAPGAREAWRAGLRAEVGRLTAPRVKLAGAPIGAAVDAARAHIREAIEGRVIGVRYPWRCVHELVGLLVAQRQTVLAGIAGHGKTTWAQQVAQSVARRQEDDESDVGEAVYFLTGEMPRAALLTRWACSLAGLDVRRVEGGAIDPEEQERLGTWLAILENLPIIIDDEPASAATVARRVKAHQAEFAAGRARTAKGALLGRCRLRLVIGDHAQELEKHEQGRERVERVERCALGWRDEIAKGCKAATLLLSQLRPPTPDEWKLSPRFPPWPVRERLFYAPTEITASADTLIAVQRPERLMRGKVPAKWIGVAAVSILKGRFGDDTTRALLGFDGGFFSEDLPAAMKQALSLGDDDE